MVRERQRSINNRAIAKRGENGWWECQSGKTMRMKKKGGKRGKEKGAREVGIGKGVMDRVLTYSIAVIY